MNNNPTITINVHAGARPVKIRAYDLEGDPNIVLKVAVGDHDVINEILTIFVDQDDAVLFDLHQALHDAADQVEELISSDAMIVNDRCKEGESMY